MLDKEAELDYLEQEISPVFSNIETAETLDSSTPLMTSEDTFATILYKNCLHIFGEEFLEWEVDTILLSLKNKFGDLPQANIDKILSLVSIHNSMDGRFCFFNEMNCFRNTVNALNGLEATYDFLGFLIPQHIHWAIYEIQQLYPEYKLDEEPAKFMALSYYNVGALLLPEDLAEYQMFLNKMNCNSELAEEIMKHWKQHQDKKEDDFDEEDVVHIQMLMLKSDTVYMEYRKKAYQRQLDKLPKSI